jgi:hypothetical protein
MSCAIEDRAALPGKYLAQYGTIVDHLTLHPDGTFEQQVSFRALAQTEKATGRWFFSADGGSLSLEDGYLLAVDDFGRPLAAPPATRTTAVSLGTYRLLGSLRLGLNEEISYRRQ